ncbi:MAG: phosphoesterase [Flavobacteriaceae bacterium]|nr:phosphoesterase [Flavobacteriaceae bacterium]
MMNKKVSPLIIVLFFICSCATYKAQYANEGDQAESAPDKEISHTVYLIGDAGISPENELSKGLKLFKKHLSQNGTKEDVVLFLGDNIYEKGLPKKSDPSYEQAKYYLDAQIESVQDFNGEVIFIPGNHDWYSNGLKGLKRQEKYVEDALGKNSFLPEDGCPLKTVEIGDSIELIIIDSQWYLENWNHNPTINDDCEIKTRQRFFEEVEGELKKAQHKKVIFAMHHPMFTNGVHGGQYAAAKHLFPSQKKWPLPILASLAAQIRTQGGVSIQDRYNERYNELMNRLNTLASSYNNVVFASGHEHTLQYIEDEKIKQIVSGSGGKASYATLSNNGLFSYGKQGFAKLNYYEDGSVWVQFFGENEGAETLLFQKEIFSSEKRSFDVSTLPDSFPPFVEASIYTKEETDVSGFYEAIWGDKYRDLYSTKINAQVATLDTLYGGLEIVREGGGHQTRSLRLKLKDGRELNMRALKKSATQYLQTVVFKDNYVKDAFEKTKVENLILDFYTAAHPYAFMVVPDLSDAAEVYHTNPRLFYIPKHKHMGDYNLDYGDELYLIEERPEENYSETKNFGYADDIESTHDIIAKIRQDEKYKIDENAFIRARLFDMLLGDWDRHQDQWRWAQFDMDNGDKYYRPIPRDRDQVFSNFDGALLDIMRFISGSVNQLQVYDETLEDIEWMNAAGVKLDRILIQKLDRDAWLKHAAFLKDAITDEVVENAFSKVPEAVSDDDIADIKQKFKGRRDNIIDIAERYFLFLNELVILAGTDKDDDIKITRLDDGKTNIRIARIIDGEIGEVMVDRTFDREITKEIWVYALDDKDVFTVSGKGNNLIFIRLIGGQENDIYRLNNGRRIKVYDHKSKKNTIEVNNGGDINLTDIYNFNLYDFNKNITKNAVITPTMGFNPDDGFKLGLNFTKTKSGFERNPFSQQHDFSSAYYFATEGFELNYRGEFSNIFENWNLHLAGKITSENFTNNFFGFGNETTNDNDNLDFNRVKTSIYNFKIGVIKKSSFGSDFVIRAGVEGIELEASEDRFITEYVPSSEGDFYKRRFFTDIEGAYNYKSFDDAINPTRGMVFSLNIGARSDIKDISEIYGFINSNLGFYNALTRNRKLVLRTNVNSQFRIGSKFEFFQASTIGGNTGLRGFRTERFTGKSALTSSADLRYSFNAIKTRFVPLQFGLFTGLDVGRVWLKNDDSDKWHNDYGGGFWVAAAESISGTFNFFNSTEGFRFSFGFGLNF